jgi:hypothetical protein
MCALLCQCLSRHHFAVFENSSSIVASGRAQHTHTSVPRCSPCKQIPVEACTFGNEAITVWTPQTWASASTMPGRSAAGNIKHLTSSHTWLFAITADISALQSLRRSCVDDAGESMKDRQQYRRADHPSRQSLILSALAAEVTYTSGYRVQICFVERLSRSVEKLYFPSYCKIHRQLRHMSRQVRSRDYGRDHATYQTKHA